MRRSHTKQNITMSFSADLQPILRKSWRYGKPSVSLAASCVKQENRRNTIQTEEDLIESSGAACAHGGCNQCWGKLLLKVMHYNIALLHKK